MIYTPLEREFHQLSNDVLHELFPFIIEELWVRNLKLVFSVFQGNSNFLDLFRWIQDLIPHVYKDIYISLEREFHKLSNDVLHLFIDPIYDELEGGNLKQAFSVGQKNRTFLKKIYK